MRDLIVGFLKNPSPETYAELRKATAAEYIPELPGENQLWELLEAGKLQEAQDLVPRVMLHQLMSPSFHLAVARLAEKQDDEDRAGMEQFFAVKLREQLLATGDGSQSKPYVISRIEEEYTVLAALEQQVQDLSMKLVDGRWLDVMRTRQGQTVHFDVSIPLGAYGRL